MIQIEVGKVIKNKRKEAEFKAKLFAKELGITYQHLWQIESGKTNIGIDMLYKISKILGITISYIIATAEKNV